MTSSFAATMILFRNVNPFPPSSLSLLLSSLYRLYRSNVNYATPTRHWRHPSSPALQLPTLQHYIKPTVWDHSPIWLPLTVLEPPRPSSSCFTCYQLSHTCSTAQCCTQAGCRRSSCITVIIFNLIVLLLRRQTISSASPASCELHSYVTHLHWLMFRCSGGVMLPGLHYLQICFYWRCFVSVHEVGWCSAPCYWYLAWIMVVTSFHCTGICES